MYDPFSNFQIEIQIPFYFVSRGWPRKYSTVVQCVRVELSIEGSGGG